ncbi:MAG TPA: hypothetical protein VKM93_25430 [Terriglobia bacterium]|nr:hypothetical protein [Terriglobia bacterium]
MFARKIQVEILEPVGPRPCPLAWLDSYFMRSFTGHSAFDETLPVADGLVEAGFAVDLGTLQPDLENWLSRKFGQGATVKLRLKEESAGELPIAD